MKSFKTYLEEARAKFAKEASNYGIKEYLKLRTAIDSFFIAYDQAVEEALIVGNTMKDIDGNNIESGQWLLCKDKTFLNKHNVHYVFFNGKFLQYDTIQFCQRFERCDCTEDLFQLRVREPKIISKPDWITTERLNTNLKRHDYNVRL